MLPWFHCHSQLNNSPSFKPTYWVKATKSMPGDIYLFHHDNSQPLSPSRHYQCYEGHPHILCTPVRPQQTRTSSVSQQTKWNQSYSFLSLWHICPHRVFNSPFHFLHPKKTSITTHFHFSCTSSGSIQLGFTCTAQGATTRQRELTTKWSWLNSFWSCFSNFAFSSGDFCREFKASSWNSRFRVAEIFSPGSTIPFKEEKQTNKKILSFGFYTF